MAKKAFVATVQLLITDVDDEEEASDVIFGMLTDCLVAYREGNVLLDWAYLKIGAQLLLPVQRLVSDDYQEGDFWSR